MNAQRTHESSRQQGRRRLRRLNPVGWLPRETRAHARQAGVEEFLALRGLLDAAIARLQRREGDQP